MYELFKIISVIAIILWALRDKIDEPRNVKYCCNKVNETKVKSSSIESSLIEVPSDDDAPAPRPFVADETPVIELSIVETPSHNDTPAAQPFIADETPVIELLIVELSTIVDMPAAESTVEQSTVDMPHDELSTIANDEPEEEDIVSVEDLYGDYTDLLMPSIILRLSNNTSVNNTFVYRTPRNNCFGVVHTSI